MKKFLNWVSDNKEMLIKLTLMLPIIAAIIISINHVITWYLIANPTNWAIFLSVGVEIAAICTLLSLIFAKPGWHIYSLFIVVTLIQIIGNVFFSYHFIDESGLLFQQWHEFMNILTGETWEVGKTKFYLSIIEGITAPLLSLLSLHLLSKLELKEDNKKTTFEEKEPEEKEKNMVISQEELDKIKEDREEDFNPLKEAKVFDSPGVIKEDAVWDDSHLKENDGFVYEDVEEKEIEEIPQEQQSPFLGDLIEGIPPKQQSIPRIKTKNT